MSRKTKLICTLGPATESEEMIGKLMDAGTNVFRLNMSHAKHEWAADMVKMVRRQAAAAQCLHRACCSISPAHPSAPVTCPSHTLSRKAMSWSSARSAPSRPSKCPPPSTMTD